MQDYETRRRENKDRRSQFCTFISAFDSDRVPISQVHLIAAVNWQLVKYTFISLSLDLKFTGSTAVARNVISRISRINATSELG